tara:strand:- start:1 stop:345 length:345 start_codon:yes stop_codon:yes gene_type:complete
MTTPFTTEPPHILAANAGNNVSALNMAPLPDGAGSHAQAAVNHLADAALSQQKANNISSGGGCGCKKKRGGAKRTRRRTRKGKKFSKKRHTKKRTTKRKSRSSSRNTRHIKSKK